jgi:hypothetical protein
VLYSLLSEELIDNNYDGLRRPNGNGVAGQPTAEVINMCHPLTDEICRDFDLHLIPTKRRRIINGEPTRYTYQGRCVECHTKTMYV